MTLIPVQIEPFQDTAGNARVGLSVTITAGGTTSPALSLYTDSTGGTPLANPGTTNNQGLLPVAYLNPSGLDSISFCVGGVVYRTFGITGIPLAVGARLASNSTTPEAHGAAADGTTDDTAAIQAAIDAAVSGCVSDGTFICEVLFDSTKTYLVSGALVQGGARKTNAQITLPAGPAGQYAWLRLGSAYPIGPESVYSGTTRRRRGPIIRSSLTGQVWSGTYGLPSVIGGGTLEQMGVATFSTLNVEVDGITIETPDNPTLSALDLSTQGNVHIRAFQAATSVADTSITLCTYPQAWAIRTPADGNGGTVLIDFLYHSGYYTAGISEHAVIRQMSGVFNTVFMTPFGRSPSHPIQVQATNAYHCPRIIAAVDPSSGIVAATTTVPFTISSLDIEDAPSGAFVPVYHIDDTNSAFQGYVAYLCTIGGAGTIRSALLTNGATGIGQRNIKGEVWHEIGAASEPAFVNSWVNYGAGEATAAFSIDGDRRVTLKGLLKSGTVGASMFVLPVGYRPPQTLSAIPVVSNGVLGTIGIGTDGTVVAVSGNNTYLSLNGLSFRAA